MKYTGNPLVSLICTSFNHEAFIPNALRSIIDQTYDKLEVILIDNGSQDKSQKLLKSWQEENKERFVIKLILRNQTINYCKSFNEGFDLSQGKYFIDFSTDDALFPEHISRCVAKLEAIPSASAVFSDAFVLNKNKKQTFFPRTSAGKLKNPIEEGWIYEKVVASHHILSSAMMMRSEKFKSLGKYDEALAYEDFDIIVRMAREYPIVFSDHIGVDKLDHPDSFSKEQYRTRTSRILPSTLRICQKIAKMNRSESENQALLKRVMYEWRQALISANFKVAEGFLQLASQLSAAGLLFRFYKRWTKSQWDISIWLNAKS